jgi:hypothetical protein
MRSKNFSRRRGPRRTLVSALYPRVSAGSRLPNFRPVHLRTIGDFSDVDRRLRRVSAPQDAAGRSREGRPRDQSAIIAFEQQRGFGGFQMYAGLERAAAEVYAAVLDDVARFLLNAKSDAVTLERLTMDLAGDIVDELEWRRGKIDGPLFDGLVRRVRAVMEKARKDVIEEFVLGLVGGRRWPP